MIPAAFYAPLKPPSHPVPSGDREMARGLLSALRQAGYAPEIASELRSRDGKGDPKVQQNLTDKAQAEVLRLTASGRTADWRLWVTYHNYYKAPDLIGPAVSRALGIPYVLIESSRARKRLTGAWAAFAQAAEAASDAADVIFYLTEHDAETLRELRPRGQKLVHLKPFLSRDGLPDPTDGTGAMLSIGMMRKGDKLNSYRIISEVLARLNNRSARLDIAGDGPARAEVEALLSPFADRVRFLGALDRAGLDAVLAKASLLLWPGVNEAFGMAYLEAQAAGLPVAAQDRPGVRDVLAPGEYPSPESGAPALARLVGDLLASPALRQTRGEAARRHIADHHLIGSAARTLATALPGHAR